jgi:hypothetical protein
LKSLRDFKNHPIRTLPFSGGFIAGKGQTILIHLAVMFLNYYNNDQIDIITRQEEIINMKKKPAIIAAFISTLVIAAAMLLMGMNAYFNPNTVAVSNSPAAALPVVSANSDSNIAPVSANTSDQVKQLQSTISQYQQQLQQLQSQLQQVQSQLSQSNTAVQQYQSLLSQLQSRGIIQIDGNGNIYLRRGESGNR